MEENKKFPSELRMDIVSKDWVVIATGRAKKPGDFSKGKTKRKYKSARKCPFCDISTQKKPTAVFCDGKKLILQI